MSSSIQADSIEVHEKRGSVAGKTFLSHCPIPDIEPRTRIIACVGATDEDVPRELVAGYKKGWCKAESSEEAAERRRSFVTGTTTGQASPYNDGWLISDFFLFYHLFSGTAAEQSWLTCVEPDCLVYQYGEYAHGDPASDCKVVLDASSTQDGNMPNVLVSPAEHLRDILLETIRQACRDEAASENPRPILLLIFGHGATTFGITVGSGTHNVFNIEDLRTAIKGAGGPRKLQITLLTTSCYGGSWAITPNLNITTVTAATELDESTSWPQSSSIGRMSGSHFATAVATTLTRMTLSGIEKNFPHSTEDSEQGETFARFADIVQSEMSQWGAATPPSYFSAQDDKWEMEWKQRAGFKLADYKGKWDNLRSIPPSSTLGGGATGSIRLFPEGRPVTESQALRLVRWEVHRYLSAKPGRDYSAKNITLHNSCRAFLSKTHPVYNDTVVKLWNCCRYRLVDIMQVATQYVSYLELSLPACHEIYPLDGLDPADNKRFGELFQIVVQYPLFDQPQAGEGHYYAKGDLYIALGMFLAGWTDDQATTALNSVVVKQVLGNPTTGVGIYRRTYQTVVKEELLRKPTIFEYMKTVLAKSLGKRLRSVSPRKRTSVGRRRTDSNATAESLSPGRR